MNVVEKKLTFEEAIKAMNMCKERADRLAEKVKTLETENVLLKDALHKMGSAAQETDVWQMKLDAFYFRCKSMATCARCPVYTHKAVSTLCLRPSQEFTEAELDTLLACFERTDEML